MVNLDTETRDALRALAFSARMSQSEVAADALRSLLPIMEPFMGAIGKLKEQPHLALAEMAMHAETVAAQAKGMIRDAKRSARQARPKTPPSSNTGG